MSVRTLLIGGLGLAAAVSGAAFVVRANSGDIVEAPTVTAHAVPAGDLLTQSAPPPTIARPRTSTPVPSRQPVANPLPPDFSAPPSPGPSFTAPIPTPDSLDPFGDQQLSPPVPVVEPPVDAATVDPAPLRTELRQLLDEKLDLLTVPQLQAAIIRTESEIRELKAQDRLERLRHELENLSRDYPQTWGGNAAQKLFNVPLPPASLNPSDPTLLPPGSNAPTWLPDPNAAPAFTPASPMRGSRKAS